MNDIDTTNRFCVSLKSGDRLAILNPPVAWGAIKADDALVLAAWLVTLAEPYATHTFAEVLAAVQNT